MKLLRHLTILTIFLVIPSVSSAFDNALFEDLMTKVSTKDYGQVEKFLESNKTSLAGDPAYYVLLLNYVVSKGDRTEMLVGKGVPQGNDPASTDSQTGEVAGAPGNAGGYDEALIIDGITRTQKALEFFSSRLDIHFGIVAAAMKIARWDLVGMQLNTILEKSIKLDNKWVWGPINAIDGEPKVVMLQNVLSKTSRLFQVNTKQADEALAKVSETMVRLYPKEIYGYANLGTLHLAQKEYDRAEQYYQQALEIDPQDRLVLENMAKLKALRNNPK